MTYLVFDSPAGIGESLVLDQPGVLWLGGIAPGPVTDADFIAWLKSDEALPNILVETYALVSGVRTMVFWSTSGYTTPGIDNPVFYAPVISASIPFKEALALSGAAGLSAGDIEVDNTNGVNEAYASFIWADELVAVIGDVRWAREDYRPMFVGHSAGLVRKGGTQAFALRMRDMMEGLNYPLTEQRLGTGSNPDALKPLTFGEVCNASGVWSDVVALERQWHDGAIEGIPDVRANALPINDEVVIYEATGKAVLTVNNESATITATVQGDKFGGIFRTTIAALIERIVTGFGKDIGRYTSENIDAVNFAQFEADNPQPVGLYSDTRLNVIDACAMLASSVGAQLAPSLDGTLQLIKIALPAPGAATVITADHMFQGTLKHVEHIEPIAAVKLGYCKNWTVQQGLLSNLPAFARALFEGEYPLYVTGVNEATKRDYKIDGEPKMRGTLLLNRADALDQVDSELALWSVPRDVYEFEGTPEMLLLKKGQRIVVYHELDGMINGVEAQVLELTRNWFTRAVTVRFLK